MVVAAGALLFSLISVLSCEGWNEKEEEEGDVGCVEIKEDGDCIKKY